MAAAMRNLPSLTAYGLVVCGLGISLAVTAQAQSSSPASAPATPAKPGCMSIGAGVGISYDFGGGGGLTGLGALGNSAGAITPFGIALFEWALSPSLRLMTGVTGSYTKRLHTKDEPTTGTTESRWSGGAGIGARWVLNPGQVVEISPALLIGVHGGRVNDTRAPVYPAIAGDVEPPNSRSDSASVGVDGRLGFVLEHALLSQLYLRFETYLLRAGADWTGTRVRGPEETRTKRGEFGLGWGVSPMLQLRLTL